MGHPTIVGCFMPIYDKNIPLQLGLNLHSSEYICKCDNCEYYLLDWEVVKHFGSVRALVDRPITVTSGFRCHAHNEAVGGRPLSRHLSGEAIDLACPEGMDYRDFYLLCSEIFPFTIAYPGKGFVHCDIDLRQGKYDKRLFIVE